MIFGGGRVSVVESELAGRGPPFAPSSGPPAAVRFSALDALSREELSGELQCIHKELSATTVSVTHSIQEAVLLADRVVVLSPHPGEVRRILDISIPQPRSLGFNAHLADVSRVMAELHDLLLHE